MKPDKNFCLGIAALVVSIVACIGTYLAIPGFQDWVNSLFIPSRHFNLSSDYKFFDDFSNSNTLNDKWWLDDSIHACQLNVVGNKMIFNCQNPTSSDIVVTLHPKGSFDKTTGVAVETNVEKAGGSFELVTNWKCSTNGAQLAYHLSVSPGTVNATEYFPQDNWHSNILGKVQISSNQNHLLQLETNGNTVDFFVDQQKVSLDQPPSFTSCFVMSDWGLDFLIWKDKNQVNGYVSVANTRQP